MHETLEITCKPNKVVRGRRSSAQGKINLRKNRHHRMAWETLQHEVERGLRRSVRRFSSVSTALSDKRWVSMHTNSYKGLSAWVHLPRIHTHSTTRKHDSPTLWMRYCNDRRREGENNMSRRGETRQEREARPRDTGRNYLPQKSDKSMTTVTAAMTTTETVISCTHASANATPPE